MKVLFVTNHSAPRCGIQMFGNNMANALRAGGVEVEVWDGCYQSIYEKPYLPYDRLAAGEFDLIHFNWHPIAINHYGADHFPKDIPLSVYVNDSPRWTWCPVWDRADVKFMPEPWEGTVLLPYPCLDYAPQVEPLYNSIGWTGVRGDGKEDVIALCNLWGGGWVPNLPDPDRWLSAEEEIERLAKSTFNMLIYQAGRGISGAVMNCISALRPVVLNDSPMFAHLRTEKLIEDEFYWTFNYGRDTVAAAVQVMVDMQRGCAKLPINSKARFGWSKAVETIKEEWGRLV